MAVLAAIRCRLANPSGPRVLYQDKSIKCEAMFCPPLRRLNVLRRWVRGLK